MKKGGGIKKQFGNNTSVLIVAFHIDFRYQYWAKSSDFYSEINHC